MCLLRVLFFAQGGTDPPFVVSVEKKPTGEMRRFHGAAVDQPRCEPKFPPSLPPQASDASIHGCFV